MHLMLIAHILCTACLFNLIFFTSSFMSVFLVQRLLVMQIVNVRSMSDNTGLKDPSVSIFSCRLISIYICSFLVRSVCFTSLFILVSV